MVSNIASAINSLFYIDNVLFNDTIAVSNVYQTIASVDGVSYQQIQKLVRADQDQTFTIVNKVLTSNVATLTTAVPHNLSIGQTVAITGVDSTFNGTFVVTAVSSTTFSYALVATNVSTIASSGSVTALVVKDIVCGLNEIPTLYELGTTASPTATGIGNVVINATGGILS